ncbi:hypothetical protein MPSEU_000323100 [Mayamaea pseudoterrestris]|nr:hypothetical protein MPSEU_000323100 [Mayamaea pseudoterrestris]
MMKTTKLALLLAAAAFSACANGEGRIVLDKVNETETISLETSETQEDAVAASLSASFLSVGDTAKGHVASSKGSIRATMQQPSLQASATSSRELSEKNSLSKHHRRISSIRNRRRELTASTQQQRSLVAGCVAPVPSPISTRRPTMMPTRRPTMKPSNTRKPTNAPIKAPTRSPNWITCGPSVRRAWHDTSCEDRKVYLNALRLLYKLPATNSLGVPTFFDFVRLHTNARNNYVAHGDSDGPFLHWHRWYIYKFEQALQLVSGTCVTLPYWDTSKNCKNPYESEVLKPESFGSYDNLGLDNCVLDGVANKDFWTETVTGGCLKRAFDNTFAYFPTEPELARLITSYPLFGNGFSGFSNNLQGGPHGSVHNWIGYNMATMASPDDPLFMLHHANVDRIWALYQDFYNQDLINKQSLSDAQYATGREIDVDTPLPYFDGGNYPEFFNTPDGRLPTPRDVHHNYGNIIQVTFANDKLGQILMSMDSRYATNNNPNWFQLATGDVNDISCSRRLEEEQGSIASEEVNEVLGIPDDVPPFTDIEARIIWSNLTSQGLSPSQALNSLVYIQCEEEGNGLRASPEWIAMQGMPEDYFQCFSRGDPSDCEAEIEMVSSDDSLQPNSDPVNILSFDETSVTISLSQVWKPGTLDMVALHYIDTNGIGRCDIAEDVFTGEFGFIEAECRNGFTGVMIFATDATFPVSAKGDWLTDLCRESGVPSEGTLAYSTLIPCSLKGAQCPQPSATDPLCDGTPNYVVASETFKSDADGWIFGTPGKNAEQGTFLKPQSGTSKTYKVPSTANGLTVTLTVYELDCSIATEISIFVGMEPISLGTFSCSLNDDRSISSGNIKAQVVSVAKKVDKVVLSIPPEKFKDDGRLTLGLSNPMIGFGSVSITADCTAQFPTWKDPEVVSIIEQVSEP